MLRELGLKTPPVPPQFTILPLKDKAKAKALPKSKAFVDEDEEESDGGGGGDEDEDAIHHPSGPVRGKSVQYLSQLRESMISSSQERRGGHQIHCHKPGKVRKLPVLSDEDVEHVEEEEESQCDRGDVIHVPNGC